MKKFFAKALHTFANTFPELTIAGSGCYVAYSLVSFFNSRQQPTVESTLAMQQAAIAIAQSRCLNPKAPSQHKPRKRARYDEDFDDDDDEEDDFDLDDDDEDSDDEFSKVMRWIQDLQESIDKLMAVAETSAASSAARKKRGAAAPAAAAAKPKISVQEIVDTISEWIDNVDDEISFAEQGFDITMCLEAYSQGICITLRTTYDLFVKNASNIEDIVLDEHDTCHPLQEVATRLAYEMFEIMDDRRHGYRRDQVPCKEYYDNVYSAIDEYLKPLGNKSPINIETLKKKLEKKLRGES